MCAYCEKKISKRREKKCYIFAFICYSGTTNKKKGKSAILYKNIVKSHRNIDISSVCLCRRELN